MSGFQRLFVVSESPIPPDTTRGWQHSREAGWFSGDLRL